MIRMSKYYCCYFSSFEELKRALKKVDKSSDAQIIAQSLEARGSCGSWIREAYDRCFELSNEELKKQWLSVQF